jgi:transposase InsO family protein
MSPPKNQRHHPRQPAKSAILSQALASMLQQAVRFHQEGNLKEAREKYLQVLKAQPRHPRTNGNAERFIQTSLREWAYRQAYESSTEREAYLLTWLHDYNHRRPHASLNHNPPISRIMNCEQRPC